MGGSRGGMGMRPRAGAPARRAPAPRRRGGMGTGLAVGMAAGMMMGGGRRRRRGMGMHGGRHGRSPSRGAAMINMVMGLLFLGLGIFLLVLGLGAEEGMALIIFGSISAVIGLIMMLAGLATMRAINRGAGNMPPPHQDNIGGFDQGGGGFTN